MALSTGKTAGLGLALLLTANAYALGLGEVVGRATLGQPLHLEIPVLGSEGAVPASSCFRLRAPLTEVGNDFAARNARVQAVGDRGAVKLVVTTTAALREPVIGFAVVVGCGSELAKDYVLLAGLPAETPAAAAPAPAPAPELPNVAPPPKVADAAAVATTGADVLRIDAPISLEALARQKYPNQPKAREKFMRMMVQANAGLAGEGAIAAGTELRLPRGLPQRRIGPYLGEAKDAAAPTAPAPSSAQTVPAAPAAVEAPTPKAQAAASPAKDRLVLGAPPRMSEAKLLEEAERLTAILVEQNKTQEAMTENLAKLEASYGDLKKEFTQLQQRLARVEAERLAEKQAATMSVNVVELVVAVLAGGAIGGFALHFYLRLRTRRQATAESAALDVAPIGAREAPLPWSKSTAAAPAVAAASAAAVVIEELDSAPVIEPPPRASTPIDAALAAMATTDSGAPLVEMPVVEEAAPAAPAPAETPTAEPVAIETAVAASDDLESLSLDFPLLPETPIDAPALELPALAAADIPPLPVAEAPVPETLTLDFPEIPKAGPATTGDHVIEFDSTPKDNALDFSKS